MAQQTDIAKLPWPELTDIPNAETAFSNLAEAIDPKVITTYASAAARTSALAGVTLTQGVMTYLEDSGHYDSWTGSAWVNVANSDTRIVWKTVDTARVTATLATDPHLTMSVVANAKYVVEMSVAWNAFAAGDINWDFTIPAGANFNRYRFITNNGSTNAFMSVSSATTQQPKAGTDGIDYGLDVKGILNTAGSAGTFAWRWAENAAFGSGTTVFADSYMRLTRIP